MIGFPRWKPGFRFTPASGGSHQSKVPLDMWMREARIGYDSDRLNPDEPTAKALRDALCKYLGLVGATTSNVLFHTVLNSPLDLHEGIDGFIDLEIPAVPRMSIPVSRRTVTIDVASHVKPKFKADFMVNIPDYGNPAGRNTSAMLYAEAIGTRMLEGLSAEEVSRVGIVRPAARGRTGTKRVVRP